MESDDFLRSLLAQTILGFSLQSLSTFLGRETQRRKRRGSVGAEGPHLRGGQSPSEGEGPGVVGRQREQDVEQERRVRRSQGALEV